VGKIACTVPNYPLSIRKILHARTLFAPIRVGEGERKLE
jgi:hypothetical protein